MPRTASNCKVITTCFVGREIRPDTTLDGIPEGWFAHAQTFPDPESVLQLVEVILEIERTLDPGAESDTIIVNNDVGWERGNTLLNSIDGTKTLAGHLRVLHRPNFGRSFGGYNAAFERYGDDYEYWTFTEDDILVNGANYLRKCIDRFNSGANIGFVALQGLSTAPVLHAHGGVGTTHARVLRSVRDRWGSLPHRREHESQGHDDATFWGELMFTYFISRIGYELVELDRADAMYVFAEEYIRQSKGLPIRRKRRSLRGRALRYVSRIADSLADRWD